MPPVATKTKAKDDTASATTTSRTANQHRERWSPSTKRTHSKQQLHGQQPPEQQHPNCFSFATWKCSRVRRCLALGALCVSLIPMIWTALVKIPTTAITSHYSYLDSNDWNLVKSNNDKINTKNKRVGDDTQWLRLDSEAVSKKNQQPPSPQEHDSVSSFFVCDGSILAHGSAQSLWRQWLPDILDASRLPQDVHYRLHDLTAQVLHKITPLLPQSVQQQQHASTIPQRRAQLERLARKTKARYQYIRRPPQTAQSSHTQQQPWPSDEFAEPPPPITIVVLGGSVTAGVNCQSGIPGVDIRICAWPARLEIMINAFVMAAVGNRTNDYNTSSSQSSPPPLVKVYSFAVGGTNTEIARNLWEYKLLPIQVQEADILIHAFATNDMHVNSAKSAVHANKTLQEAVFDMSQDFIRTVLTTTTTTTTTTSTTAVATIPSQPCRPEQETETPPPLLMWLDDYLGNEQNEILKTTAVSQSIHLLSNYYGFASISYANAVRTLVYSDTYEDVFSPNWYRRPPRRPAEQSSSSGEKQQRNVEELVFVRDIHGGQGMHMAISWVVAYNLLQMATQHCSMESYPVSMTTTTRTTTRTTTSKKKNANQKQFQQVGNNMEDHMARPYPQRALPPRLNSQLLLSNVTQLWRAHEEEETRKACNRKSDANINNNYQRPKEQQRPCIFSWVVGFPIPGQSLDDYFQTKLRLRDVVDMGRQYFANYMVDSGGWDIVTDSYKSKVGWVPPPPAPQRGAATRQALAESSLSPTMILEFRNLTQPIHVVHFGIMKSYGPKWDNSMARVEVVVRRRSQHGDDHSNKNHRRSSNEESDDYWESMGERDLIGFHTKNTSEMYIEPLRTLQPVLPGNDLRIRISHKTGLTFKLQGISVCS